MARGAGRVLAVLLELLAQRRRRADRRLVQVGHVRRRIGRRRVQQVVEDPLAAQHRRRARRRRTRRSARWPASARRPRRAGQVDAAELRPGDAGDPVMLRQALVEEACSFASMKSRMLRSSRMTYSKKQLRLAAHRQPQVVVEVRETLAIAASATRARGTAATARRTAPTSACDLRIAQHAPHLRRQDAGIAQRAGCRPRAAAPSSGMLAQRKYDSRVASSCWRDAVRRRRRPPAAGGRARCGTGSPARPESPGSRRQALLERVALPSAPTARGRRTGSTSRARDRTAERAPREVGHDARRARRRVRAAVEVAAGVDLLQARARRSPAGRTVRRPRPR